MRLDLHGDDHDHPTSNYPALVPPNYHRYLPPNYHRYHGSNDHHHRASSLNWPTRSPRLVCPVDSLGRRVGHAIRRHSFEPALAIVRSPLCWNVWQHCRWAWGEFRFLRSGWERADGVFQSCWRLYLDSTGMLQDPPAAVTTAATSGTTPSSGGALALSNLDNIPASFRVVGLSLQEQSARDDENLELYYRVRLTVLASFPGLLADEISRRFLKASEASRSERLAARQLRPFLPAHALLRRPLCLPS